MLLVTTFLKTHQSFTLHELANISMFNNSNTLRGGLLSIQMLTLSFNHVSMAMLAFSSKYCRHRAASTDHIHMAAVWLLCLAQRAGTGDIAIVSVSKR